MTLRRLSLFSVAIWISVCLVGRVTLFAGYPPYVIQYTVAQAGSVASLTTPAINTTSGSVMVACLSNFGPTTPTTAMSDNKSNTWIIATRNNSTPSGAIFYCENCTGGSGHTFTFTPTGSSFIAVGVVEIGGARATGALNAATNSNASVTTHHSGTVTATSTDDELMIGCGGVSYSNEGTPVVANGFFTIAALADGSPEGLAFGYKRLAASATDEFIYNTTAGNNRNDVTSVASFLACVTGNCGNGTAPGGATPTSWPFIGTVQ